MKLRQIALVGSLLFVLVGCGNDSPIVDPVPNPTPNPSPNPNPDLTPVAGTISGTVTAPSGGNLTGAAVVACLETDTECAAGVVGQISSTGAYTVTGLQASPYIVIAAADVDSSGTPTAGDYVGIYTTDGTNPAPVTPPATSIDITMQAITGGTPAPAPTPGDLTGTWTGTTTTQTYGPEQTTLELAQNGSSISGTLNLVGAEGSPPLTGTVNGSQVMLSATYAITENGAPTGDEVEYDYSGTVTGSTMAGTVTLNFSDGTTDSGQFSVTQGSASTAPLDKALIKDLFRNIW